MKKLFIILFFIAAIISGQERAIKVEGTGEAQRLDKRVDTVKTEIINIKEINDDQTRRLNGQDTLNAWLADTLQGTINYINSFFPVLSPLSTPVLVSATADDDSANIKLIWTETGSGDSTLIQRALSGGAFAQIDHVAFGTKYYRDITAIGNTSYDYRILTRLTDTYSNYSNVKSATSKDTASAPEVTADYFIDPYDGNDGLDGRTPATAYKTINKLNLTTLTDRDGNGEIVVAIKAGTINNDVNIFYARNNVRYTTYGGTTMATIQSADLTSYTPLIYGVGGSGFTIENIKFIARQWASLNSMTNTTFRNCAFLHYNYDYYAYAPWSNPYPFDARYSNKVKVIKCYIKGSYAGASSGDSLAAHYDLMNFAESDQILFDSTVFVNAMHNLVGMNYSDRIAFFRCRFYSAYHSALNAQSQADDIVVSDCYVERQGSGIFGDYTNNVRDNEGGGIYLNGRRIIFRFSVVSQSGMPISEYGGGGLSALSATAYEDGNSVVNNVTNSRYYNFTLFNNYTWGLDLSIGTNGTTLQNNKAFNFAIVSSSEPAYSNALMSLYNSQYLYGIYPSGNEISNSYLGAETNNIYTWWDAGLEDIDTSPTTTGYTYSNNLDGTASVFANPINTGDSLYVPTSWAWNPVSFLDSLMARYTPTGVLVDAGREITTVASNSTGATLTVNDAYPFFDGHGWIPEYADSVMVMHLGSPVHAQINSSDKALGELYLNQSITVSAGDKVYVMRRGTGFAFKGSEIDIGYGEAP